MGWIGRAWRGEERLWKVFWIYGVLVSCGFAIVDGILKHIGLMPLIAAYIAFRIVYGIWLMVAEWRCAFNLEWVFWGYVIRILIVLSLLGLLVGGVMVGQELGKVMECRKEAQAYTAAGGKDVEVFRKKCIMDHIRGVSGQAAVPTAPVADPNAPMDAATAQQYCRKSMEDFARDRHADPQQYIAQNQKYLQECTQYHINPHGSATGNKP